MWNFFLLFQMESMLHATIVIIGRSEHVTYSIIKLVVGSLRTIISPHKSVQCRTFGISDCGRALQRAGSTHCVIDTVYEVLRKNFTRCWENFLFYELNVKFIQPKLFCLFYKCIRKNKKVYIIYGLYFLWYWNWCWENWETWQAHGFPDLFFLCWSVAFVA